MSDTNTNVRATNNLIKVAASDLQLGMYIFALEEDAKARLKSDGMLRNKNAIEAIIKSNVQYVWVDKEKSHPSVFATKQETESKAQNTSQSSNIPKGQTKTRQLKNKKAKKVITEARSLANKIIQDTFADKPINLGELDDWAENVIDTIIEDSDALKFVSMLRSKDTYLLEHSVNVACLLVTFGTFLGFDRQTLKYLAIGGMIHDIGKTKVRSEVLNKPGKLLPEEFEHMKMHQDYAHDLLIEGPDEIHEISRNVCLMHHEKLDGSGYPLGLTADQLPIYGRMSSIVDIYDALTAERCYKKGMPPAAAFKILLSMVPDKLDEELVYKFINCIGIYPAGSLVELSNGAVGIVEAAPEGKPLAPDIRCFYSMLSKKEMKPYIERLSTSNHKIERSLPPTSLGIDLARVMP